MIGWQKKKEHWLWNGIHSSTIESIISWSCYLIRQNIRLARSINLCPRNYKPTLWQQFTVICSRLWIVLRTLQSWSAAWSLWVLSFCTFLNLKAYHLRVHTQWLRVIQRAIDSRAKLTHNLPVLLVVFPYFLCDLLCTVFCFPLVYWVCIPRFLRAIGYQVYKRCSFHNLLQIQKHKFTEINFKAGTI